MPPSRPRRNPDGSRAIRSVDDLLAEAVAPEAIQHLPGKGQPLDLQGYFHADPEQRVASRLMRDNNILPQPLQDRREAEISRDRMVATLKSTVLDLNERARRIHQWGACLSILLAAEAEWSQMNLPDYMLHPMMHPRASALETNPRDVVAELVTCVQAYRSCRRRARQRLLEISTQARDKARGLNEHVMLNRHLPASLQIGDVDVKAHLAAFDAAAADLPDLPVSILEPLTSSVSWWKRLWFGKGTH